MELLKIGHRGAKGHAPENTLISFQKALELGVDGMELDVHLSTDNQIMVIHDETVNRTTNGNGFVNQLPLTFPFLMRALSSILSLKENTLLNQL